MYLYHSLLISVTVIVAVYISHLQDYVQSPEDRVRDQDVKNYDQDAKFGDQDARIIALDAKVRSQEVTIRDQEARLRSLDALVSVLEVWRRSADISQHADKINLRTDDLSQDRTVKIRMEGDTTTSSCSGDDDLAGETLHHKRRHHGIGTEDIGYIYADPKLVRDSTSTGGENHIFRYFSEAPSIKQEGSFANFRIYRRTGDFIVMKSGIYIIHFNIHFTDKIEEPHYGVYREGAGDPEDRQLISKCQVTQTDKEGSGVFSCTIWQLMPLKANDKIYTQISGYNWIRFENETPNLAVIRLNNSPTTTTTTTCGEYTDDKADSDKALCGIFLLMMVAAVIVLSRKIQRCDPVKPIQESNEETAEVAHPVEQ